MTNSPTSMAVRKLFDRDRTLLVTSIAAGVDIRTVAGRLGHGGGGTTTLRVYAAWVSESDQRAAGNLGARMPTRPSEPHVRPRRTDRALYPYEVVAAALRGQIEAGELAAGEFLPGIKALAALHGVAVGTAHRAVSLLVESGQVAVVAGRGLVLADCIQRPTDETGDASYNLGVADRHETGTCR